MGRRVPRRTGRSSTGMDYYVLGDGPRTLLAIPGGPGSEVPGPWMARLVDRQSRPYLDGGYTVWGVTRRRGMPRGHTVADMADDYAAFVREQLGGQVDLVVGESYGGMIVLHLAADHPEVARHFVVAVAAATVDPAGSDLDARWARARAAGRYSEAGAVMLEAVIPGPRRAVLRRAGGVLAGWLFRRSVVPPGDLLVEADAELSYDARPVLPRIRVPVLLACGDADEFFSRESVQATADGIAGSTLIWYPGLGHVKAASNAQLFTDIVEWVRRREAAEGRDGRA